MTQVASSEKDAFTHFNVRLEWVRDPRLNATDWLINQGWRDEGMRQARARQRPMTHLEALEDIRRNCIL